MAVILSGPVSAMYSYQQGTYAPFTNPPVTSPTKDHWISQEELDKITSIGDIQKYTDQLLRPPNNDIPDVSDSSNNDSSQVIPAESSDSNESSSGPSFSDASNNTKTGTQIDGESLKTGESRTNGTHSSKDTPGGAYTFGGIVSVLALAGIGFFFKGSLLGR